MICAQCVQPFVPKAKGYNARYCTDRCKRRNQRARLRATKPEQTKAARRRSWVAIKNSPERLAIKRAGNVTHKQQVRAWLASYKLMLGCYDCGYNIHSAALQLDHEGQKTIEIADARSSVTRLKQEIEDGQCRVRCANCHAIRTWKSKQKGET